MSEAVPGNFGVRTSTFLLVPARVFLGLLFILMVVDQWNGGWLKGTGMQTDWGPWVQTMPIAPLRDFLTEWVLPFGAAAGIIVAVEFVIGAFLILGFSVRLVSLLGMVLTGVEALVVGSSVYLAHTAIQAEAASQVVPQSLPHPTELVGLYGLMFLVLLVFLSTGAGRSIGLDGFLWRRAARRLARAKGLAPEPPTTPASE